MAPGGAQACVRKLVFAASLHLPIILALFKGRVADLAAVAYGFSTIAATPTSTAGRIREKPAWSVISCGMGPHHSLQARKTRARGRPVAVRTGWVGGSSGRGCSASLGSVEVDAANETAEAVAASEDCADPEGPSNVPEVSIAQANL